MSDGEVVSYLRWKKDVDQHDYAAASSYLSIRFGQGRAEKIATELRKLPVITRRANDILRATGRDPLPLSDPGVLKDLKKVLSGEKLSPILVAEADVADGYHRLSLAYALDPYADVPLKLGGVPNLLRGRPCGATGYARAAAIRPRSRVAFGDSPSTRRYCLEKCG
jgi:hypothetical protein